MIIVVVIVHTLYFEMEWMLPNLIDDAKEFVDEWIEIDEYNKKINK